ncbi:hypothetical protein KCP70_05600 [Salmonella enterica subsp. enterica]|nr:hypothetical protein KCP70_05600 [Salmonella enterica subsp. enterica]
MAPGRGACWIIATISNAFQLNLIRRLRKGYRASIVVRRLRRWRNLLTRTLKPIALSVRIVSV